MYKNAIKIIWRAQLAPNMMWIYKCQLNTKLTPNYKHRRNIKKKSKKRWNGLSCIHYRMASCIRKTKEKSKKIRNLMMEAWIEDEAVSCEQSMKQRMRSSDFFFCVLFLYVIIYGSRVVWLSLGYSIYQWFSSLQISPILEED